MAVFTRVNGTFTAIKNVVTRVNGNWTQLQQVYTRVNGQWVTVWRNSPFATLARMSVARSYPHVQAVNGYIFVIGGTSGNTSIRVNERYDLNTNTWARVADPLYSKVDATTWTYNGKIYMHGGSADYSTGMVYDVNNNTYATFNQGYLGQRPYSAEIGGIVYIAGGIISGAFTSNHYALNMSTMSYARKADIPQARGLGAYGSANGKMYAISGSNYNTGVDNSMYEYNPTSNTWSKNTTTRDAVDRGVAWSYNNYLYVVSNGATVDRYQPSTNTWAYGVAQGSTNDIMRATNGVVVGNQGYAAGGELLSGGQTNVITSLTLT